MSKLKPAFLIATFAFFLLAVSSPAAAQSSNGTIYICVNLHNWQVRNVSRANECKKNEVSIVWNSKLLKGDKGDRGPAGPQGPAGPRGATGVTGPQGPPGATGATGPQGYSIKTYMDDGSAYPLGCGTAGGLVLVVVDAQGNQVAGPLPQYVCNGRQGIEGPQGPQGAQGPQGPQGAPGSGAAPGIYVRQLGPFGANRNEVNLGYTFLEVRCFTGDLVVGGGFSVHQDFRVIESKPVSPDKWMVTVFNPTSNQNAVSAFAVCLDLTP